MSPKPSRSAIPPYTDVLAYASHYGIDLAGFKASPVAGCGPGTSLIVEHIRVVECSANMVIVTMGQLRAGLTLPLYNAEDPFFCEVLSQLNPRRGIMQLTGNAIRILNEFTARRSKRTVLPDKINVGEIEPSLYTAEAWFRAYGVKMMTRLNERWGVRFIYRPKVSIESKLLWDVDQPTGGNQLLRKSSDEMWMKFPIVVEGTWVFGWSDDARTIVRTVAEIPQSLSDFHHWEFSWREEDRTVDDSDSEAPPPSLLAKRGSSSSGAGDQGRTKVPAKRSKKKDAGFGDLVLPVVLKKPTAKKTGHVIPAGGSAPLVSTAPVIAVEHGVGEGTGVAEQSTHVVEPAEVATGTLSPVEVGPSGEGTSDLLCSDHIVEKGFKRVVEEAIDDDKDMFVALSKFVSPTFPSLGEIRPNDAILTLGEHIAMIGLDQNRQYGLISTAHAQGVLICDLKKRLKLQAKEQELAKRNYENKQGDYEGKQNAMEKTIAEWTAARRAEGVRDSESQGATSKRVGKMLEHLEADLKLSRTRIGQLEKEKGVLESKLRHAERELFFTSKERDTAFADGRAFGRKKYDSQRVIIDRLHEEKTLILADMKSSKARSSKLVKSITRLKEEIYQQKEKISQFLGPCKNLDFEGILAEWTKNASALREYYNHLEEKVSSLDFQLEAANKEKEQINDELIQSLGLVSAKEAQIAEIQTAYNELLPAKLSCEARMQELERKLLEEKALSQARLTAGCKAFAKQFANANGLSPPCFADDPADEAGLGSDQDEDISDDEDAEDGEGNEDAPKPDDGSTPGSVL